MRKAATAITLMAAAALAACAGSSGPLQETKGGASVNVYPDNYRSEILAYLRSYLNDPTGIREAMISQPAPRNVGVGERYVSCVRFNAKGPSGGHAGPRDYLVIFLAGKLDQMGMTREDCRAAAYQPFPELERLTR